MATKEEAIESTCLNTQNEAKATNICWKLCNVWRMEVQAQSLHGHTKQHLARSSVKIRKGNNSTHRCRTNSCSRNTWGSRALDTTGQQPQVHPYQHNNCSSNGVPSPSFLARSLLLNLFPLSVVVFVVFCCVGLVPRFSLLLFVGAHLDASRITARLPWKDSRQPVAELLLYAQSFPVCWR